MPPEGFRQDMPPKGGYASIIFERVPLKKPWSGVKWFSAWLVTTVVSFYIYGQNQIYVKQVRRENDEVTVAIEPLLIAERDRIYLNQLRNNRDEEKELMKNVPGWKVGTYFGEPLYKTINEGRFMHPIQDEYYAHAKPSAMWYHHLYDIFF